MDAEKALEVLLLKAIEITKKRKKKNALESVKKEEAKC